MFLESGAEGAIAVEAALLGKGAGRSGLQPTLILTIQADEVLDTQTVDIGIIGDALLGKVGTEVGRVKGIILGSFNSIKFDLQFGSVEQMLVAHLHDLEIPVCCGFPVHNRPVTLRNQNSADRHRGGCNSCGDRV